MADKAASTWLAAYDVAERLYDIQPWECVNERDVFGVRCPGGDGGQTVYVSVMGEVGEHTSVAFYLGDDAVRRFQFISANAHFGDMVMWQLLDIRHVQISFEKPSEISGPIKKWLRAHKVYRKVGADACPVIYYYAPQLCPWPLTDRRMLQKLVQAFETAVTVLEEVRDGRAEIPRILSPDMLPVVERAAAGEGVEWSETDIGAFEPAFETKPLDPEAVKMLETLDMPRVKEELGISLMVADTPAQWDEKHLPPTFAVLTIVHDKRQNKLSLGSEFEDHPLQRPVLDQVQWKLAQILAQRRAIPANLSVSSQSLLAALQAFCDHFDIDIVHDPDTLPEDTIEGVPARRFATLHDLAFEAELGLGTGSEPGIGQTLKQVLEWREDIGKAVKKSRLDTTDADRFERAVLFVALSVHSCEGLEPTQWTPDAVLAAFVYDIIPDFLVEESFMAKLPEAFALLCELMQEKGSSPRGNDIAATLREQAMFLDRMNRQRSRWNGVKQAAIEAAERGELDLGDVAALAQFTDQYHADRELFDDDEADDDDDSDWELDNDWDDSRLDLDDEQSGQEPLAFPGLPYRASEKPGRNDPCPCGSGLKYKKCCGQ